MSGPVQDGARVPPNDLDAEGAVLAATLLEPGTLDLIRDIVTPLDMYADANRRIFEIAFELDAAGKPVDIVTVASLLRERGRLEQVGGSPYLAQLSGATPSVAHVETHARIIRDKARTRRMISTCQTAAAAGYGDIGDVEDWLQSVEQQVFEAADEGQSVEAAEDISVLAPRVMADISARRDAGGRIPGVETGWSQLTRMLNGWQRGKLYVGAGRPGMGKTGLALGACINVARNGMCAVFESAEMEKEELVQRAFAAEAKVEIGRVMSGRLNSDEFIRITEAAETLRKLPFAIAYRPGATVAQIRGDVRRKLTEQRAKYGSELELGLVAVDYIQILEGRRNKGDTRESEVSDISRGLMKMAGEFGAPVLAMSQLNRDVEKRPDKRPTLADLRESGAIEQDAYGVLFLYRDEYYNKETADRGIAEIIIAKHRNGSTGKVLLRFTDDYVRFDNLAHEADFDEWDGYKGDNE